MKLTGAISRLAICAGVGVFISLALLLPAKLGLCSIGDTQCIYQFGDYQGYFVNTLLISFSLLVLSIPLSLLQNQVYQIWKKFTVIWIPLWIFLAIITPEYGASSSLGFKVLSPSRAEVGWLMVQGYLLISLIIFILYHFRSKNAKSQKKRQSF